MHPYRLRAPGRDPRASWGRAGLVGAIALAFAVGAACSGSDESAAPDLSPQAEQGRTLAQEAGCAACHGDAGQGGVGPAWTGLAGSTVELADGTTVTADTAYLTRSITEPGADLVAGYTVVMPANALTADEVAAVVAYIEALVEPEEDS